MPTDPLPPASGPGETPILSAEDIKLMRYAQALGGHVGDSWVTVYESHEALRAVLATERAARIAATSSREAVSLVEGHPGILFRSFDAAVSEVSRLLLVCHEHYQRAEHAEASLAAMTLERNVLHEMLAEIASEVGTTGAELTSGMIEALREERDALRTALERFMSATLMHARTKPVIVARQEAAKVLAAGPQGETDHG